MTTDQLFELVRDTYAVTMWGDHEAKGAQPQLADLDGMTVQDLDGLLVQLSVLTQSIRTLKGHAESLIATEIGDGGAVRVGDAVYRYRPKRTTRIPDPQKLIDWLGDDWHHVISVTGSTQVRKGGMQAVCEKRDIPYDTVVDTFFETTESDPTVDRVPFDKAPKFLQKLDDGESWAPKPRREEGAA